MNEFEYAVLVAIANRRKSVNSPDRVDSMPVSICQLIIQHNVCGSRDWCWTSTNIRPHFILIAKRSAFTKRFHMSPASTNLQMEYGSGSSSTSNLPRKFRAGALLHQLRTFNCLRLCDRNECCRRSHHHHHTSVTFHISISVWRHIFFIVIYSQQTLFKISFIVFWLFVCVRDVSFIEPARLWPRQRLHLIINDVALPLRRHLFAHCVPGLVLSTTATRQQRWQCYRQRRQIHGS